MSRGECFCYSIVIHVMLLVPCCTPLILPVFDAVSGCGSSTSGSGWSCMFNIKNYLVVCTYNVNAPWLMCIVIAHEASFKAVDVSHGHHQMCCKLLSLNILVHDLEYY